jgi:hypothetical protein
MTDATGDSPASATAAASAAGMRQRQLRVAAMATAIESRNGLLLAYRHNNPAQRALPLFADARGVPGATHLPVSPWSRSLYPVLRRMQAGADEMARLIEKERLSGWRVARFCCHAARTMVRGDARSDAPLLVVRLRPATAAPVGAGDAFWRLRTAGRRCRQLRQARGRWEP